MFEEIKAYWYKVPSWIRNRYFLVLFAFVFTLFFIDTNNVFQLFKRQAKLKALHQQEQKYEEELSELQEQKDAFENDLEALEKFAREEYRMKKADEDVYVIIQKED